MRLKPLLCTPVESMPTSDVALLDELRTPELVALRDADGEAGHVEVAVRELPGVLGGLAAEQHALGAHAALVHAGDDVGDLLGHDLADHQVVEEEERDGAAGGDVVDAHRDEVDADGVEPAHAAGDLDLGAHAVGAGHQHGVLEARQAHGAAEPAEAAEDERVLRALQPLLHEVDGAVARLDVDAGLLVGEPLLLGHARSPVDYPPSLRPASARHPVPPGGFARAGGVVPSGHEAWREQEGPDGGVTTAAAGVLLLLAFAALGRLSRPPSRVSAPATASAPPARPATTAPSSVDLVERLPEPPQLVIFGGSRAQRFEPSVAEKLTGLPAFNFAVQNSRPEDAYAMARYLFWREPGVKLRCLWALQATSLSDSPLHPGLLAEPRLSQFLPGYLRRRAAQGLGEQRGPRAGSGHASSRRAAACCTTATTRASSAASPSSARCRLPGRDGPARGGAARPTARRARRRTSSARCSSSTCTTWSRCW